ncbi:hypothetical protein Ancab_003451 [Ancistrocladus abbreviatus]
MHRRPAESDSFSVEDGTNGAEQNRLGRDSNRIDDALNAVDGDSVNGAGEVRGDIEDSNRAVASNERLSTDQLVAGPLEQASAQTETLSRRQLIPSLTPRQIWNFIEQIGVRDKINLEDVVRRIGDMEQRDWEAFQKLASAGNQNVVRRERKCRLLDVGCGLFFFAGAVVICSVLFLFGGPNSSAVLPVCCCHVSWGSVWCGGSGGGAVSDVFDGAVLAVFRGSGVAVFPVSSCSCGCGVFSPCSCRGF